MQNSRDVSRAIRHAIADAMTNEGAEWSGWHDNIIDGSIDRSVLPLVDALAAAAQRDARLRRALEDIKDEVCASDIRPPLDLRYARLLDRIASMVRAALAADPTFVCDGCGRETHGLCAACGEKGE